MTAEELKVLLQTPLALFVVMILGSLANAMKQVSDGKRNGGDVSFGAYLSHWPETISTLIVNVLGFLTLAVTDQLNFASAIGIGYAANSAADLLRTGGRSAAINSKQSGFASIALMAILAVISMTMLCGCATTQGGGLQASPEGKLVVETSVRIAVRHAVADSPRAAQKAANIRNVVARLQALPATDSTIASLQVVVKAELDKLSLAPVDLADANDLLDLLSVALESQLAARGVDAAEPVVVSEFLAFVLKAIPATAP